EVDDPRVHYSTPVSRASRAEPLAGRPRAPEREARGTGVISAEVLAELTSRINTIEEAYEYMLAYASQGLSSDHGTDTGRQAREFLGRCNTALNSSEEHMTEL